MNCQAAQPLLTGHSLKETTPPTSVELSRHLEQCARCRASLRQIEPTLDLLRDALAASSSVLTFSAAQRRRIINRATRPVRSFLALPTQRIPGLGAAAALLVAAFILSGLLLPSFKHARLAASCELGVDATEFLCSEDAPETDVPLQPLACPEAPPPMESVRGYAVPAGKGGAGERKPVDMSVIDGVSSDFRYAGVGGDKGGTVATATLDSYANAARAKAGSGRVPKPDVNGPTDAPVAVDGETTVQWSSLSKTRVHEQASREAEKKDKKPRSRAILLARPDLPPEDSGSSLASDTPVSEGPAGADELITTWDSPHRRISKDLGRADVSGRATALPGKVQAPARKERLAEETRGSYVAAVSGERMPDEPERPLVFEGREASVAGNSTLNFETRSGEQTVVVGGLAVELGTISKLESTETDADLFAADDLQGLDAGIVNGSINEVAAKGIHARKVAEDDDKDEEETTSRFKAWGVNPFVSVLDEAFSTFGIDVDTASYTLSRNYMLRGYLPPAESVRTEEFVNFFDYGYPSPRAETFKVYTETAPSKFGRGLHLLKIGVKGRRLGREEQRPAILTFLVDTSGSMGQSDRIGLVKKSLKLLVERLADEDRVAIVQYGNRARLVLEHTPGAQKKQILAAVERLQCSGSTNLEEGMKRAYEVAARNFLPGGENRVLLLSDGVANLGTMTADEILQEVSAYRDQGILCSVFGFGMGTYDDTMLEALANQGDGAYTFVDSEEEARRVFVDDLAATLNTIATDVKIQVEFNGKTVKRYRQLGYENRQLTKEQFRDDTVDAGEVGSGQTVTALYELALGGRRTEDGRRRMEDRGQKTASGRHGFGESLAVVRVRYRRLDTGKVEEIEHRVRLRDVRPRFEDASRGFQLAAGVAEFAEILRGSPFAAGSDYDDVRRVLQPAALSLPLDARVQELLGMVQQADGMARGE